MNSQLQSSPEILCLLQGQSVISDKKPTSPEWVLDQAPLYTKKVTDAITAHKVI